MTTHLDDVGAVAADLRVAVAGVVLRPRSGNVTIALVGGDEITYTLDELRAEANAVRAGWAAEAREHQRREEQRDEVLERVGGDRGVSLYETAAPPDRGPLLSPSAPQSEIP
jgi:hypothetical protein